MLLRLLRRRWTREEQRRSDCQSDAAAAASCCRLAKRLGVVVGSVASAFLFFTRRRDPKRERAPSRTTWPHPARLLTFQSPPRSLLFLRSAILLRPSLSFSPPLCLLPFFCRRRVAPEARRSLEYSEPSEPALSALSSSTAGSDQSESRCFSGAVSLFCLFRESVFIRDIYFPSGIPLHVVGRVR